MLVHVVMWKLKDEFNAQEKFDKAVEIKVTLERLKGIIPDIIDIEVGIDGAIGSQCACRKNNNYDLCLVSSFESADALSAYAEHPEHIKAVELVKSSVQSRTAVDFLK